MSQGQCERICGEIKPALRATTFSENQFLGEDEIEMLGAAVAYAHNTEVRADGTTAFECMFGRKARRADLLWLDSIRARSDVAIPTTEERDEVEFCDLGGERRQHVARLKGIVEEVQQYWSQLHRARRQAASDESFLSHGFEDVPLEPNTQAVRIYRDATHHRVVSKVLVIEMVSTGGRVYKVKDSDAREFHCNRNQLIPITKVKLRDGFIPPAVGVGVYAYPEWSVDPASMKAGDYFIAELRRSKEEYKYPLARVISIEGEQKKVKCKLIVGGSTEKGVKTIGFAGVFINGFNVTNGSIPQHVLAKMEEFDVGTQP